MLEAQRDGGWRPRMQGRLLAGRRGIRVGTTARGHPVRSLRLLKESMDPAKYQSELEKLVTDLALKTREIRSLEGAK